MDYDQVADLFSNHLDSVYSCTRVWSAWGYGTMSKDDFILFSEDDDIINEFKEFINSKNSIDIDALEDALAQYEGFYNPNIEDNFDSDCFDEDFLSHCDLEAMANDINSMKQKAKPKSRIRP